MGVPIDKDDERWLDALAGKPSAAGDDPVSLEALAVRKALEARVQELRETVPQADAVLLEQLRFRLRQERLTGKKSVFQSPATLALAASVVLGVGLVFTIGRVIEEPGPSVVELPASLSTLSATESTVPAPLGFATLVAAADPQARAEELIRGMPPTTESIGKEGTGWGPRDRSLGVVKDGGIESRSFFNQFRWDAASGSLQALRSLFREQVRSGAPIVIEVGKNQIMLVLEATDPMLEYLRSQDIEPRVTDGEIILVIHTEEPLPPSR